MTQINIQEPTGGIREQALLFGGRLEVRSKRPSLRPEGFLLDSG